MGGGLGCYIYMFDAADPSTAISRSLHRAFCKSIARSSPSTIATIPPQKLQGGPCRSEGI
jgi:hypothetical protein